MYKQIENHNQNPLKFKLNYIVIPVITIIVAVTGSYFTGLGMEWYKNNLVQPALTPPDYWFGIAWTTIFILTTFSALIVWNKQKRFTLSINLFIANAILNVSWSFLFFTMHWTTIALVEMLFLLITLFMLIRLTWPCCKIAGALLLPYAAWVCFATYLTYIIVLTN